MFTAFTVSGLTKKDGTFSREQLMPLARRYVGSLRNYEYFTFGKGDGAKLEFADPPDYWFEYEEGVLILNFILPLKTPAKLKQLALEIYDPTYFVALSPGGKDPVSLRQAPPDCKLQVGLPARAQIVDESFFANLPDARNWAVQFATVMTVACP
jgi:ABC-type uncharacterized transport system substrate-binding protein